MSSHYETCDICDKFSCSGHSAEEWAAHRKCMEVEDNERASYRAATQRDVNALAERLDKRLDQLESQLRLVAPPPPVTSPPKAVKIPTFTREMLLMEPERILSEAHRVGRVDILGDDGEVEMVVSVLTQDLGAAPE